MRVNNKNTGIANSDYLKTVDDAAIQLNELVPIKEFKKGEVLYHKGLGPVVCNQNYSQPTARSYFVDVIWKGLYSIMLSADRLQKTPWSQS